MPIKAIAHNDHFIMCMREKASELRGVVIQAFTDVESLMDNINWIATRDSKAKYNEEICKMTVKKTALVSSIKILEDKFGCKFNIDFKKLDKAIKVRDILAHWNLTITPATLKEYRETGLMTFMKNVGKTYAINRIRFTATMDDVGIILNDISDIRETLSEIGNKVFE